MLLADTSQQEFCSSWWAQPLIVQHHPQVCNDGSPPALVNHLIDQCAWHIWKPFGFLFWAFCGILLNYMQSWITCFLGKPLSIPASASHKYPAPSSPKSLYPMNSCLRFLFCFRNGAIATQSASVMWRLLRKRVLLFWSSSALVPRWAGTESISPQKMQLPWKAEICRMQFSLSGVTHLQKMR